MNTHPEMQSRGISWIFRLFRPISFDWPTAVLTLVIFQTLNESRTGIGQKYLDLVLRQTCHGKVHQDVDNPKDRSHLSTSNTPLCTLTYSYILLPFLTWQLTLYNSSTGPPATKRSGHAKRIGKMIASVATKTIVKKSHVKRHKRRSSSGSAR